ncbi:hypothetical protein SARC_10206 [Sphaeroforma arctica JP610]|uniref:FH2 domain-containing protein n=1 Tax=Sphaeroforma arctica JP610 TaxID=667725 RepID=A0A0L0FMR8_9EUKA|nr:hypothetical protein SARC_10206 [Sphaeroforma arctica JP610]KNC77333.1 hypothetical protein SARC_10206 [Sphaeroforma arctica JP610]|eukprot:XP_014151235.1 hypothetical protein SARC_10206 [Sphaeroforma arctica JP610]
MTPSHWSNFKQLAQLKNPPCPIGDLSPTDQFVYELNVNIQRFPQRLETILFIMDFKEKMEYSKKEIDAVRLAAVELKTSKHFKNLLEMILFVGNYMNASVPRGQAVGGFQIEFINKLSNTKTGDNRSTLLHHIVRIVNDKTPETIQFLDQLSSVSDARRVQLQSLTADMAEIRVGLAKVKTELDYKREVVEDDRFVEVASTFFETSSIQFDTLTQNFERMQKSFTDAVGYFGMDVKKASPDEFFEIFDTFVDAYKGVEAEIKAADEKKARELKKQKDKEDRLKAEEDKKRKAVTALKQKNRTSVVGEPAVNVTLDDDESEKVGIKSLLTTLTDQNQRSPRQTRGNRNRTFQSSDGNSTTAQNALEMGHQLGQKSKGKVRGAGRNNPRTGTGGAPPSHPIGPDGLRSTVSTARVVKSRGVRMTGEEIDRDALTQVIEMLKGGRTLDRTLLGEVETKPEDRSRTTISRTGSEKKGAPNPTAPVVKEDSAVPAPTGRRAGRRNREKKEVSRLRDVKLERVSREFGFPPV